MKLTEEQKVRATRFESLLQMEGWKELERMAEAEIALSRETQDNRPAKDVTVNEYCEERGYRKGIRWLLKEASRIKEIG